MRKNKLYAKKFEIMKLSVLLIIFILSAINVLGGTNISILYGWNGSENVPINVDASGRLQTTINLTESIGLFPDSDNLRDLGTQSLRWANLYVFNIVAIGNVNVSTLNVTSTTENATFEGDVLIKGTLYGGSPLHVSGGINVTVASGEDAFYITDSSNNKIFRITDKGELNISSSAGNTSFDDGTLFIDTTNNRTGIGTTTPLQTLVVVGTVNITDSLNVSGTIEANTFIGDGSSLTGISSVTPPWNSSGTNVFLNDSSASVGIGTATPDQELHVNGSVIVEENLSVRSLEILSNFSYKLMDGCYEDTSIDITDDTTFCDASQAFNVTSVYYNGSWRVKCCVPQGMCFKDTDVTLTDSGTVCNRDINYSVTSIFFNADSKWQAKCCNNAGSCFEDRFITAGTPSTICDTGDNADIVTAYYSTSWEITCCERSIR